MTANGTPLASAADLDRVAGNLGAQLHEVRLRALCVGGRWRVSQRDLEAFLVALNPGTGVALTERQERAQGGGGGRARGAAAVRAAAAGLAAV
jgi:hypothetical protein